MQAKPGHVATAAPGGEPQTALQHVPKGSRGSFLSVATPTTLTLSFSLACCSLNITHSFSCLEARSQGQHRGGLSPTQPALALALPKQGLCSLP